VKKYLPSIIAILTAAATAATPLIQQLIAAHPKLAVASGLVSWLVAHWLPSPSDNTTGTGSSVNSRISMIAIFALLVPSMTVTSGCSSDQVQASITVAAQVSTSAAQIIAPVNPEAGQLLTAVGKGISDAGTAYQDYLNAETSQKDAKGAELRAALSAIQGNLSSILADVRVKNPQLVQYITVGVAVVNTTVVLLLGLLNKSAPQATAAAQSASASALPVLPAKNANDLKTAWNNACKNGYPQAVLK
jgi:hypothetical protein